jgi:hypothetical protein
MGEFSVQLDSAQIAQTLDDIDVIGNRYHGTSGETRCRDYLFERFREIALLVCSWSHSATSPMSPVSMHVDF